MTLSVLSLRRAERLAEKTSMGGFRTGRVYSEIVVDGNSLSPRVRRWSDLIGALSWGPKDMQASFAAQWLLREPGEIPDRVPLYVCPECADLGCGVFTVHVRREANVVIWERFGLEVTHDGWEPRFDEFADLGPFRFDVDAYTREVEAAVGRFGFDEPAKMHMTWIDRFLGRTHAT